MVSLKLDADPTKPESSVDFGRHHNPCQVELRDDLRPLGLAEILNVCLEGNCLTVAATGEILYRKVGPIFYEFDPLVCSPVPHSRRVGRGSIMLSAAVCTHGRSLRLLVWQRHNR